MDAAVLTIIVQLIFLECILSIDNAAVIGAMVAHLPKDQPTPWPGGLARLLRPLDRLLGPQREAALKVGLFGAYGGRILMLALASVIASLAWVHALGAVYLLYLGGSHFLELHQQQRSAKEKERTTHRDRGFWSVVLALNLADMAFSLDNVVAAVALSNRLWVIVVGVGIGIVIIRFGATIFTRMIVWEPALEHAAYLLLLAIGAELLIELWFHIQINDLVKFAVSIAILVLAVIVARARLWQANGRAREVGRDVQ